MKKLIKRSLSALLTLCLIVGMSTCAISANAATDFDAVLQGLEKQYFTDIYPGATSNLYLKNNVDGVFGPWVVSGYDDNTFVQENGRTVVTTPSTNLLMTSVDNFYLDGGFYFEMGSSSKYTDADYVEYLKIGDLKFQVNGTGTGCRYELYDGDSLIAYADYTLSSLTGWLTRYLTYSNGYLTVRADNDTGTTSWTLADGTSVGTSIDVSDVNVSGKIEFFKNDQGASGQQFPFWGFRMKGSFPYKTLDEFNSFLGGVNLTDEAEVAKAEYLRNWAMDASPDIEVKLVKIGSGSGDTSRLDNWDGYMDVTLSPYNTDKLVFSTDDIYVGDRLIKGYAGNWTDDLCTQIAFTANDASYTGCITYLNFYTPSGKHTGFSVWSWSGAIDYTLTEAGTYTMTAKFEKIKDAEGNPVDGSMDNIQFDTFEVKAIPRFFSGNVFSGNIDVSIKPGTPVDFSTTDLYVGDKLVNGAGSAWWKNDFTNVPFTVGETSYTGAITEFAINTPSGSNGFWKNMWQGGTIDYVLPEVGTYTIVAKMESVKDADNNSVNDQYNVELCTFEVKGLPRITYSPDGVVSYAGPQDVALVPNTTLEFSTTDLVVGDKLVQGYDGYWTDRKGVAFTVDGANYTGAITRLQILLPSGQEGYYKNIWQGGAIDYVLPVAGTYKVVVQMEHVKDSSSNSVSNFYNVELCTFKVKACPHNYEFTENVPAKCTTDGYDLYTCSYCGGTEHRNVVTKLGSHSYDENGVCTVCENVAEAKVGDTYYDTLQGAHDSVSANSTIIMNSNVNVYFRVEKDIILDLNGYTLTSANSGNDVITLESGNITVYDNSEAKTGNVLSNYNNSNNQYEPTLIWSKGNGKKAVIYGGTWTANADIHPNGGKMFGANLEIYGGTFAYDKASSNHTGLFNSSGYNVKLYGGNFNDNSVTPQEGYEYVEQEDGTWNVEPSTHVHNYTSEITIEATCGTNGEMTYTCSGCGNTYTEVILATGEHNYVDGECTVCYGADKRVIENESSGKKYEDFATAISEATAGDTLKLIGNYANYITITKDITLDLNGYEMTNPNGGDIITMDGGNIIIKDSVGTGKITSVYSAAAFDPVCIYSRDANRYVATIYGGTFSASEGVSPWCGALTSANMVIYGGTFIHPSSMSNGVFDIRTVVSSTVYGGTFTTNPTGRVADGYEAVDNLDGTYTVVISNPATIQFINRNGAVINEQTVPSGTVITLPALPSWYGYTCNGWMVNGELKSAGDQVTVNEDMTVSADFTVLEKTYTVTVDGATENVSGTYTYNTKITLVFDEVLLGETGHFGGWVNTSTGAVISYAETYIFYVGANVTVEALIVDEAAEIKPIVAITDTCDISASGDGTKWSFLMERSVPSEYTYVGCGFVYDSKEFSDPSQAARKKASQSTNRNGQFRFTVNLQSANQVYMVAYLIYADADGNEYTVYSNNGTPILAQKTAQ